MNLPSDYHEHVDTPQQQRSVETLWSFVADEANAAIILPDGRCDVILRFRISEGGRIDAVEPVITGPATMPYTVEYHARDGWIGTRLRPHLAGALWKDWGSVPPNGMVRGMVAASRALPSLLEIKGGYDDEVALSRAFSEVIGSFGTLESDARLQRALDEIHLSGGRAKVSDIAGRLCWTSRHLYRQFVENVGIPPKAYSDIVRFHRALRLRKDFGLSPSETAFEAGYADQAHLTRSFRKFGGFTPSKVAANLSLPGFSQIGRDVRNLQ